MYNKLKLTIAIPIYKRPELLQKTLQSIALNIEVHQFSFDIGILLIDDSCSDINESVVSQFVKQNQNIELKYIKNSFNVGIDRNIGNALFLPESDFIWLMGEDDLIVNNAFFILDKYINENVDFLAVNYATVDNNYNTIRESNFPSLKLDKTNTNKIDINTFLKNYFIFTGFIGSCIFRKSIINQDHYQKYFGSFFSHLSPFLLKREKWDIVIINEVLVKNRAENFSSFTWKKDAFDVMFGMVNLVKNQNTNISKDIIKDLELKLIEFQEIYKIKRLLSLRAEGVFNLKLFCEYYIFNFKNYFLKTVMAFLISIFPVLPLSILKTRIKKYI